MKNKKFFLIFTLISIFFILSFFYIRYYLSNSFDIKKEQAVVIFYPSPNSHIESPYRIMGQAKGYWFFEASFPIIIKDAKNGDVLANTIAEATSDWMTTDFVPFQAEVEFDVDRDTESFIIFKKDNPSGIPEYDAEIMFPVVLKPKIPKKVDVYLYYYNKEEDISLSGGNISCREEAILPVKRNISFSDNLIRDSIELLINEELLQKEIESGFENEFLHSGLEVEKINLEDGILTINLNEVPGFTSGGSCRVGILSSQIKKTAMQFEGVKEVIFLPDSIFQP